MAEIARRRIRSDAGNTRATAAAMAAHAGSLASRILHTGDVANAGEIAACFAPRAAAA